MLSQFRPYLKLLWRFGFSLIELQLRISISEYHLKFPNCPLQGIPASRGFTSRGFTSRGFFRGSDSIVLMGSTEPFKFKKWVLKPNISIKSMISCNLRVRDDCYNGDLSKSMGFKWIFEICRTYGTHVSVRTDVSRGFPFPKKICEKRGLPVVLCLICALKYCKKWKIR